MKLSDFHPDDIQTVPGAMKLSDLSPGAASPAASMAPPPGVGESALRGLEQGATLGWGSSINGSLSALLDTLSGKNKELSILEDYRKQRDESQVSMEAAAKAHPIISGAANLVGGALPALATGGLSLPEQGLAGAAKLGALYGGIGGLGGSKADLTKGELGGALKDTAAGALGGAVTGGALGAGAEAFGSQLAKAGLTGMQAAKNVGGVVGDIPTLTGPFSAFKQGLQGRRVFGASAAGNIADELQGIQSAAQTAKSEALAAPGAALDSSPWLKGMQRMAGDVLTNQSADPRVTPEIAKVLTRIKRFYGTTLQGDPDAFQRFADIKNLGLTPEQLDDLRGQLSSMSFAGDDALKTPEARSFVTNLITQNKGGLEMPEGFKPLNEMLGGAVPGLKGMNAQISAIQTAKDLKPAEALSSASKFFENLPEGTVPEDKQNQILSALQGQALTKQASERGLVSPISTRAIPVVGGNVAGLVLHGLYNMAPEEIQSLSAKVGQVGGDVATKLSTVLANAADKDHIGRNALFFAIQQNPEYRKILQQAVGSQNGPA